MISTTVNGTPSLIRSLYSHSLAGISGYNSYNFEVASANDPAAASGYHTTISYLDGFGRPIQVRDATETNNQYRVSDIFYNWRGQLMSQSYPFFATGTNYQSFTATFSNTYTVFDPIGRVAAFYPLASVSVSSGYFYSVTALTGDGGSPVGPTGFDYNDGNNPWAVVITNALGKIHKYYQDSQGRTNQIVEITSGGTFSTKLGYDLVGDLLKITDNASNAITFYVDDLGEQVAMTDPDMGFWQYDHDLDGRLKIQTDAKGQQLKFFYSDTAGRLTRREGWNVAGQCVSTNTWTYDSSAGDSSCTVYPGQLYATTDDEGWQKFSYDPRNRTLASIRYLLKNGNTYTNQFGYDDADRLISTAYPNGGPVVTNFYDGGQHLLQVASGTNIFYTAKGYNELNQLAGVNFGNGATTTFNYYRASKRLNQVLTTSSGSTIIQNFTNRYDTNGNVVAIQDLVASHGGTASATISSASYDDLNRLTTATWSGYGTKNYGYNSIGNVLTNTESGSTNYAYGTVRPHAVLTANGMWYSYDQDGNVLFRNRQRLDYDVNNHLYRVINTNGTVVTFGYAGTGERLWELSSTNTLQVWIGNNYEEKSGQTLFHIQANGQTVCTFDNTGTNVFEYYHPDYLGSTSLQTDQNGNQIQHFEYSAFGQTRYTQSTNVFKVSRLYTGQRFDDGTGLYYYNARYYDPILGRFVQPDDIISDLLNPQSYNRYSYCVNAPLRYTDPSGHAGVEEEPIGEITSELRESLGYNSRGERIETLGQRLQANMDRAATAQAMQMRGLDPKETYIGAPEKEFQPPTGKEVAEYVRQHPIESDFLGEKLYRGVPGNGTEKAILGQQGIAKPRGTALDPASLEAHVAGADVKTGVTSWTTDREIAAKRFAGPNGTVIEVNKSSVADKIVPRPNVQKYKDEKEVLLKGTIQGTPTKP